MNASYREPRTEKLTRVRKVIASRMQASLQNSAQLTSIVEVDMSNAMALRRARGDQFRAAHGVSLSPIAVVARGVCQTMAEHPVVNARIDEREGTVTYFSAVNLGLAIDTDAGLLVANLKDADERTLTDLATGISDLARRARSRQLTPDDLEGGTFTLTNTGSRGSLLDTPILNFPEVGILAVGKVSRRPTVVHDEEGEHIEIRDLSYLCLTYDHRLVDGADAARFLSDLKQWLETHDLGAELKAANA